VPFVPAQQRRRRRFGRRRPLVDTSAPAGVRDLIVQAYAEADAMAL